MGKDMTNKNRDIAHRRLTRAVGKVLRPGVAAVLAGLVTVSGVAVTVADDLMLAQASTTGEARSGAEVVILQTLQGLRFVPALDEVETAGVKVAGLDVARVPMLDTQAFRAIADRYLGETLTLGELQRLIDEVVVYSRSSDRPVVDVLVPEQDVTGGTVQVVVLEGRLGTVSAVNNRWFRSSFLANNIRLSGGEPVSARTLQEDLAWLNRNPFRQVDAVFVPGAEPGTTDIRLQVQERFPLRVYASYENSGNEFVGRDLWSAGFNWGNVFDTDHQFGYQYDRNSGSQGALEGHHLSYVAPLPFRHILTLTASYVETDSNLFDIFDIGGRSTRVGARWWMPLERGSFESLEHGIQGGVDFKRTNNNLDFFGFEVFDDTAELAQFVVQYAGSVPDRGGLNSWYADLVYSPGGLTSKNEDEFLNEIRTGATADYTYVRLGYDRLTRLPRHYTWNFGVSVQQSGDRLLPSEQMGVGGQASVRGFEEREISGDSSVLVTNELRTPSRRLSGDNWFSVNSEFQFLAFFEWGQARNEDAIVGEFEQQALSSAGLGFRYRLSNHLTIQADHGWQLVGKNYDPEDDARTHVRVLASY